MCVISYDHVQMHNKWTQQRTVELLQGYGLCRMFIILSICRIIIIMYAHI